MKVISSSLEFAVYDFPVLQVAEIVTVLVISILAPYFVYRSISKHELTERIHYK